MAIINNDPKKLFAENLNRILKLTNMTAGELATAIGVGSNTISTWRTQSRFPGAESLEQIANYYALPVHWFFVDHINGGTGSDEKTDGSLKITSDEMTPSLLPNDTVFFRLTTKVENGSLAVINLNGTICVRRVYYTADNITFSCTNPAYAPLVYPKNAAPSIIGEVIKFERNF